MHCTVLNFWQKKHKLFIVAILKPKPSNYYKCFCLKVSTKFSIKHYKKGGSYEHFVGRDASRSFVTGDFKNDLNDNLDGLSDSQISDIINWKQFYDTSYTFIGLLEGRFHNKNGEKTEYLLNVEKKYDNFKQV